MTQIMEETERSEEEEDDFDTVTNQNLTINLPKHIQESFQMRKTELELMTGNPSQSYSPVKM